MEGGMRGAGIGGGGATTGEGREEGWEEGEGG